MASSMTPADALLVRADLLRAREAFVLACDLHLTFLATPIGEEVVVNWQK